MSEEVLVVASKIRSFVKEKGQCNTSADTIVAVSKVVEAVLIKAIETARAAGRKTVMARDVAESSGSETA